MGHAKDCFSKAFDLCPMSEESNLNLAVVLHIEGRVSEAIELYHQVYHSIMILRFVNKFLGVVERLR